MEMQSNKSEEPMNELDEEDLMLIAENAGIQLGNSKRKRIFLEDSDDEDIPRKQSRAIKNRIKDIDVEHKNSNKIDDLSDFIVFDENENEDQKTNKPRETHRYREEEEYEYFDDRDAEDIFGEGIEEASDEEQEEPEGKKEKFFEPAELEQGRMTAKDIEISLKDLPERMQRRRVPVKPAEKHELEEEAMWIHKQCFIKKTIFSLNRFNHLTAVPTLNLMSKVTQVLDLIRNCSFEIPFIQHYRKEHYEPELNPQDLWSIYDMDEEWMLFNERRSNLVTLYIQMKSYQTYFEKNPTLAAGIDLGVLIDTDSINYCSKIDNPYEIHDFIVYFSFYYSPKLHEIQSNYTNNEVEELKIVDVSDKKLPSTFNHFQYCQKSGVINLTKSFGLSPAEFGINLKENYPRHVPAKCSNNPNITANLYISKSLETIEAVLNCAIKVWAIQIAHDPVVRQESRNFFFTHAKITCKPTIRGSSEIDESHPYYQFKYIRRKPLQNLTPEMYLRMNYAKQEGLINIEIEAYDRDQLFVDSRKNLFQRDEYNSISQEWNNLRYSGIKFAYDKYLKPQFEQELVRQLDQESNTFIINKFGLLFQEFIDVAKDPKRESSFIFGLSLPPYQYIRSAKVDSSINDGYCAVISSGGNFVESFIINSVITRNPKHLDSSQTLKRAVSLELLQQKINHFNPICIALSAERRETIDTFYQLKDHLIPSLNLDKTPPTIELVPYNVPKIAAKSNFYNKEFPSESYLMKLAVSVARYSMDALVETVQLFENIDDAIPIVSHPLYRYLPKEKLFAGYQRILINYVNKIGVDINKCYTEKRYSRLLQYISGFGPAKAVHTLMALRKLHFKIKARTDLITLLNIGPIVFVNCAGFLKIHASGNYDNKTEPLDITRIHPESYDIAKNLLSYLYNIEPSDSNSIIDCIAEIQNDSDRFFEMNTDDFVNNLESSVKTKKDSTIEDIKSELVDPFRDDRIKQSVLTDDQLFWMLASDGLYRSSQCQSDIDINFGVGRIISVTVTGFSYRKPTHNDIKSFNHQNDRASNEKCPYCHVNLNQTNQDLEIHIKEYCQGELIGLRVRLDCGFNGFISVDYLSENINDNYQIGLSIFAKVLSVNTSRYSVELSCKASDLSARRSDFTRDHYFDFEAEEADKAREGEKKDSITNRVIYQKKLVVHSLFKNVTFEESEKLLRTEDKIDCIIRPSSKGPNHLTVSIKIDDNIISHTDVIEEEKLSDYCLGKKLLINDQVFEDLDEIYARFVSPYLSFFKSAQRHKNYAYFAESDRHQLESYLKSQVEGDNLRIPYVVSISKSYPGKIYFAYMNRNQLKLEYLRVTNHGYRSRNTVHQSIDSFISWFKEISKSEYSNTYMDISKTNTPRFENYQSSNFFGAYTPTATPTIRRFNNWNS